MKEVKLRSEAGNRCTTTRVKSKAPWVPPGRGSIRDVSYKWEGHTHGLELTPPLEHDPAQSPLRLSDLSTEEEEVLHGRISQYERKIDSLMTEVSSLKNQAELQRNQLLECQAKQPNVTRHVTGEREELMGVSKELEVTDRENTRPRRSLGKIQEVGAAVQEKEVLLRKLVEAEVDGVAAAKQASALQETVGRTRADKRLSRSEATLLAQQKDLLMQKLEMFQGTNQALRHLLREHHEKVTESTRLCEQREMYLGKLADAEAENAHLVAKLQEKEKEVEEIVTSLESEKENAKTTAELSKALESNRAQLQQQLRSKDNEKSRLAVQMQNLEWAVTLREGEVEQLRGQLAEVQRRSEADGDALRRATRAQKQQAQRGQDMETQLADALAAVESWRSRHTQKDKEKAQLEMEMALLNNQLMDLRDQLHCTEDKAQSEREGLFDRLHRLTSENTTTRLENQRLRASMSVLEEKLTTAQSEVQKLKSSLNDCEGLVDSYRNQLQKASAETYELSVKLELAEKEACAARAELDEEVGALRRQLTERLAVLELLPGRLRRSEAELRDSEEQVRLLERRSAEQSGAVTELRLKVEQQGNRVEAFQQKNNSLRNENKHLKQTVEKLERKLEETNSQNRDLLGVIAKREETIHGNQLLLEEKAQECSSLARQLEAALGHAKRQVDWTSEWAVPRERSSQSRVLDLETQLSLSKAELAQLRRNKEEAESQLQRRIEDMKKRVTHLDSDNRSLQNYIEFLKTSYGNVYGNSVLTASSVQPSSQF